MLITELKSKETIEALTPGKVFIINCHGCREVSFPEEGAVELRKELAAAGKLTGFITTDYICNVENLKLRLEKHRKEIDEADMVLVFSCGVGVQTVAEQLSDKKIYAGCFKKIDYTVHIVICSLSVCVAVFSLASDYDQYIIYCW